MLSKQISRKNNAINSYAHAEPKEKIVYIATFEEYCLRVANRVRFIISYFSLAKK